MELAAERSLPASHAMDMATHCALVNTHLLDPVLVAQVEQAKLDLASRGYATLTDILSAVECEEAHADLWSAIKEGTKDRPFPLTHCPTSAQDLAKFRLGQDWSMNKHGILEDGHWAHLPVTHDVRTHPRVVAAFCLLYGNTNLLGACDRINYQLPTEFLPQLKNRYVEPIDSTSPHETLYGITDDATWLHIDQSVDHTGFACVQGLVQLTPALQAGDASFECVPGSHHFHDVLETLLGRTIDKKTRKDNWLKFTDEDKVQINASASALVSVKAPAGTLIWWDSRLMHQGGTIRADAKHPRPLPTPRFVVYTCFQPLPNPVARTLPLKEQQKRNQMFAEKRASSHWPLKVKLFGPPRTYGKEKAAPFDLSSLLVDPANAPVVAHYLGYDPSVPLVHKRTSRKRKLADVAPDVVPLSAEDAKDDTSKEPESKAMRFDESSELICPEGLFM